MQRGVETGLYKGSGRFETEAEEPIEVHREAQQ